MPPKNYFPCLPHGGRGFCVQNKWGESREVQSHMIPVGEAKRLPKTNSFSHTENQPVISEKAAGASRTFSERVARKKHKTPRRFVGSRLKSRWLFDGMLQLWKQDTKTCCEIPSSRGSLVLHRIVAASTRLALATANGQAPPRPCPLKKLFWGQNLSAIIVFLSVDKNDQKVIDIFAFCAIMKSHPK